MLLPLNGSKRMDLNKKKEPKAFKPWVLLVMVNERDVPFLGPEASGAKKEGLASPERLLREARGKVKRRWKNVALCLCDPTGGNAVIGEGVKMRLFDTLARYHDGHGRRTADGDGGQDASAAILDGKHLGLRQHRFARG